MMLGLAEFIMRGRWQALAVAILGSGSLLFGWISAAAVALVTLRNGIASGGWLVLWALLPATVIAAITGDTGSMFLLAGTYLLALILRESVSLALALLASVPMAVAGGLLLGAFNEPVLQDFVSIFNDMFARLGQELQQEGNSELTFGQLDVLQLAALLATGNSVLAVLSLILGRYWQAALYNPGGFGEEFRSLKLPLSAVLTLAGAAIVLWLMGPVWSVWGAAVFLPLTFLGFALLHSYAAYSGKGNSWLVLMYSLWTILDPVKWLFVGCAITDAFVDFRSRWSKPSDDDSDEISEHKKD